MDNISKFTEPTYSLNVLDVPSDSGFGVGFASGGDHYGCAHNQYTYCDGSGITPDTIGKGIGRGEGEANNLKFFIHEENIMV